MRTIVTIISLAVSVTIYAQKDANTHLHWRDNSNGKLNLQASDLRYTEKGKFYYYLSNDKDNLYIDLRIFDKDVQRQVLASGLSVWLNMDGKKAKKTGLRYPARIQSQGRLDMAETQKQQSPQNYQRQGNAQDRQNPWNGMPGGENPSGGRSMQMGLLSRIELIGLSGSDHSFISSDEANNFRGSLRFEKDGNMWYELIIPLSKLPEKSPTKKKNDGSCILGLSYPGINFQRMGGGPGGGAGGYGGGGMDEGMGGRGGGGRGGRSGGGGGGMRRPGGSPGGGGGMGTTSVSPVIVWFKNIQFASE